MHKGHMARRRTHSRREVSGKPATKVRSEMVLYHLIFYIMPYYLITKKLGLSSLD
jgi:hypothetical protein